MAHDEVLAGRPGTNELIYRLGCGELLVLPVEIAGWIDAAGLQSFTSDTQRIIQTKLKRA
jgi:hypothetical protein